MRTDSAGLPAAAGPHPKQVAAQPPSGVELLGFVQTLYAATGQADLRELSWLQDRLDATGHAAYNMALMPMEEWVHNPLYTKLKYLHDIRHEVQAPVVNRDGLIGTLHLGTDDPDRRITPYEVQLTEALGVVIGTVIEGLDSGLALQRERDQAVSALDRAGTAVVLTDLADPEPRSNAAARSMLAEVVGAERHLNQIITRPGPDWNFSRHVIRMA